MAFLRTVRRIVVAAILVLVLVLGAWAAVVRWPQPLFRFSVTSGTLTLYSDTPFQDEAGQARLDGVRTRLDASPLYDARDRYDVFICNTRWRHAFFFNRKYRAGGLSYFPLTGNVFLRDADVEANRLHTTAGKPVAGDRTLEYFIAHELTHAIVGRSVGAVRYWRLPTWIREGYADYVAKGRRLDYAQTRRAFLAGTPELDPARSGLYLRYHLLVAHYLDKQNWTVQDLLATALPQGVAEEAVREEDR